MITADRLRSIQATRMQSEETKPNKYERKYSNASSSIRETKPSQPERKDADELSERFKRSVHVRNETPAGSKKVQFQDPEDKPIPRKSTAPKKDTVDDLSEQFESSVRVKPDTRKVQLREPEVSRKPSTASFSKQELKDASDDLYERIFDEILFVKGYLADNPDRPSTTIYLNSDVITSKFDPELFRAIVFDTELLRKHDILPALERIVHYMEDQGAGMKLDDLTDSRRADKLVLKLWWSKKFKIDPSYKPKLVWKLMQAKKELTETFERELPIAQEHHNRHNGRYSDVERLTRVYKEEIAIINMDLDMELARPRRQAFYVAQDSKYIGYGPACISKSH